MYVCMYVCRVQMQITALSSDRVYVVLHYRSLLDNANHTCKVYPFKHYYVLYCMYVCMHVCMYEHILRMNRFSWSPPTIYRIHTRMPRSSSLVRACYRRRRPPSTSACTRRVEWMTRSSEPRDSIAVDLSITSKIQTPPLLPSPRREVNFKLCTYNTVHTLSHIHMVVFIDIHVHTCMHTYIHNIPYT